MGIRILTEEEISAHAVDKWRSAYQHWSDEDRFAKSVGGHSKKEVNDLLNASDQTPDEIARILNEGWARPQCGVCNAYVATAVHFQDEWSEDRSLVMCGGCLAKAQRMLGALTSRRAA